MTNRGLKWGKSLEVGEEKVERIRSWAKKEELKEKENILKKDVYQAIILQLKIN